MNSLILSDDDSVVRLLRRVLSENGTGTEVCSSAAQFREIGSNRKFDVVFVECDGVAKGSEALQHMRTVPSNHKTIGFAVVSGITTLQKAFEMGANFVLNKPFSAESLTRSLRAAQGLMERERRRYYRHPLSTSVHIRLGSDEYEYLGTR